MPSAVMREVFDIAKYIVQLCMPSFAESAHNMDRTLAMRTRIVVLSWDLSTQ